MSDMSRFLQTMIVTALAGSLVSFSLVSPSLAQISLAQTGSDPRQATTADLDSFKGRWMILSASPGPWAENPADPVDDKIAKRLIGKMVTFAPQAVTAPQPLGCRKATYTIRDAPPESFFEGGLAQGPNGQSLDTAALAKGLGVTTPTVKGLTASCSEVEFYQIAPDTLLFGMDNRVYRLERRKS